MPARSVGRGRLVSRGEVVALVAGVGSLVAVFFVLAALVWHSSGPIALDGLGHRVAVVTGVDGVLADGGLGTVRSSRLAAAAVRLGEPASVAALAGLLLYLAIAGRDRIGALVAVLGPVLTGVITEYVAKPLIGRRAPTGKFMFPSGHTGGVAAVCVAALVIVYRRAGVVAAACLAPVAATPVVLVGMGVVHLGYHWSTDVAGGVTLAGIVVVALSGGLVLAERAARHRRAVHPARRSAPAASPARASGT